VAEHAQPVDEVQLDRCRGQALSSVRLNTTFGRADRTSANAAWSSVSRIAGSVSHGSLVS
jgi:hypothetical protein